MIDPSGEPRFPPFESKENQGVGPPKQGEQRLTIGISLFILAFGFAVVSAVCIGFSLLLAWIVEALP